MNRNILHTVSPDARRYIYMIVIAAIPILTAAGIALPGGEDQWLLLAAAILGVGQGGLALANVRGLDGNCPEPDRDVIDRGL